MSSSEDELPDIPGTQYPWMEDDGPSTSSRSPRKKRPRVSAVEKEKKMYKEPKKKSTIRMQVSCDDDDFETPGSEPSRSSNPGLSVADIKRQKARERRAKSRANRTEEKKEQDRAKDAARKTSQTEKQKDAQRKAAVRATETPEERAQRNQANAQQTAAARANETPEEHAQRN